MWTSFVVCLIDLAAKAIYLNYSIRQTSSQLPKRTQKMILEIASMVKDLICLIFLVKSNDQGSSGGGRLRRQARGGLSADHQLEFASLFRGHHLLHDISGLLLQLLRKIH